MHVRMQLYYQDPHNNSSVLHLCIKSLSALLSPSFPAIFYNSKMLPMLVWVPSHLTLARVLPPSAYFYTFVVTPGLNVWLLRVLTSCIFLMPSMCNQSHRKIEAPLVRLGSREVVLSTLLKSRAATP